MSHTLHRIKTETGKQDDYVVLIMPARGINNHDVVNTFRKYMKLLYSFSPVNMGGLKVGTLVSNSFEELLENVSEDAPMIHAVYKDRETLIEVMKALKEADYGYSVVVSGLVEDVDCCAKQAGIQRHSVDLTLGIWGDTSKLPPEGVLEITTMCGHAMVSANLVNKMIDDIRKGKTTARKAAEKLAEPCACGIFNTDKAERLLNELSEKL
ncbi:MAG: hypothetical protein IKT30_02475 [Bacteroidaceae bacterium]|nr:hypothetical protein [Bacteroidaceae bacterium]